MTTKRRTTTRKKKSDYWTIQNIALTSGIAGIFIGGFAVILMTPSAEDVCYELYGDGNMKYVACVGHLDNIGM